MRGHARRCLGIVVLCKSIVERHGGSEVPTVAQPPQARWDSGRANLTCSGDHVGASTVEHLTVIAETAVIGPLNVHCSCLSHAESAMPAQDVSSFTRLTTWCAASWAASCWKTRAP